MTGDIPVNTPKDPGARPRLSEITAEPLLLAVYV